MNIQSALPLVFEFLVRQRVEVEESKAPLSSDAGLLPIREFDRRLGWTEGFAAQLTDHRQTNQHALVEMVRQRVFGILAGYEDQNDHDALRSERADGLGSEARLVLSQGSRRSAAGAAAPDRGPQCAGAREDQVLCGACAAGIRKLPFDVLWEMRPRVAAAETVLKLREKSRQFRSQFENLVGIHATLLLREKRSFADSSPPYNVNLAL